jgi:hypothetical protein
MGNEILSSKQIHSTNVFEDRSVQAEQINTSEEFLNRLYDKTVEWLKKEGKVIQEFEQQKIEKWEILSDYHKGSSVMSIELLNACVIEDPRKIFLLTLGRGRKSEYSVEESLRLQFGLWPVSIKDVQATNVLDIEDLKHLLYQGVLGSHGSGEIFAGPNSNNINVDCWANESLFGGKEINRWPSERIFTNQGLEEALSIIKETVKRAFGEDLT